MNPAPPPAAAASPALLAPRARPLSHPFAFLIIALFTTLVMLPGLGTGDPTDMMELFNLVPTREAYRDGHWLMPTLNGEPRFEKPPLAVWIPASLVTLLGGHDSLLILRLPSLLLSIVTGFFTYGIGCLLFGQPPEPRGNARRIALLAALFLPAMLLFHREARLASYDIYATAFTTASAFFLLKLAEEGRLAADASTRLKPARALLWILLSGLALGFAMLSKGPAPSATVLLPMAVWLLLHHRRASIFLGIPLLWLLGSACLAAWALTIWKLYPASVITWTNDLHKLATGRRTIGAAVDKTLRDPVYYYLQIFIWTVPLTPSLIAGLVMPFMKSEGEPAASREERRGRWLMWAIILGGLVILSIPSEKKPRYAVQLLPWVALLCAAVWQEFVRFPAHKKIEPAAGLVLAGQALFFIVPGIIGTFVVAWAAATGTFFRWPQIASALSWWQWPLFLALTVLGIYAWHLLARRNFRRAIWMVAAPAALLIVVAQSVYRGFPETHTNEARIPTEQALAQVAPPTAPIYTLRSARPWLPTLFFANRVLIPKEPEEFADLLRTRPSEPFHLLLIIENEEERTRYMKLMAKIPFFDDAQATHRTVESLGDWDDANRRTALYRYTPAAPATLPATNP